MPLYSYEYQKQKKALITQEHRIRRILIHSVSSLASLFLVLLSTFLLNYIDNHTVSPISAQSLGSSDSFNPVSTPSPSPLLAEASAEEGYQLDNGRDLDGNLTPTPSLPYSSLYNDIKSFDGDSPEQSRGSQDKPFSTKKLYTIAIIGDSMVDTMGEVLEYLDSELKTKYPKTKFLLYNYGTGAQNIEMGLARFGSHFNYQSRDYQPIPELKPDILIVASFAYNPFTPHDRDKHWLTLTKLVETAKQVTPRVYMLAEIAPLREDFGKGPQGVNWSDDTNYEHTLRIIQQLENTVGLSKALTVPLIDAFTPSFNFETREGKREYVNSADGIHPSIEGNKFMAEKIAETIKLP